MSDEFIQNDKELPVLSEPAKEAVNAILLDKAAFEFEAMLQENFKTLPKEVPGDTDIDDKYHHMCLPGVFTPGLYRGQLKWDLTGVEDNTSILLQLAGNLGILCAKCFDEAVDVHFMKYTRVRYYIFSADNKFIHLNNSPQKDAQNTWCIDFINDSHKSSAFHWLDSIAIPLKDTSELIKYRKLP